MDEKKTMTPSRRAVLGSATGVGLIAGAVATGAIAAPAVLKGSNAGRKYKAFVVNRPVNGARPPGRLESLTLLALQPRHVLIRTEASSPGYTMVPDALGLVGERRPSDFYTGERGASPFQGMRQTVQGAPPPTGITVCNNSFVGIVDAVGSDVTRVRSGDRVIVTASSHCGRCYQCLNGAPDSCELTQPSAGYPPIATLPDGTYVDGGAQFGTSELNVAYEEFCTPVFTDAPPAQLSLLGSQLSAGLASVMCRMEVRPGTDVVVFGAGPVGLGAIQGARIMGAGQVIVVEPIKVRRDLAMKLGATTVLDPAAEGAGLVEKIRELCKGKTDRMLSGGNSWTDYYSRGADYAVASPGMQHYRPKTEAAPDPTGVLPFQQAWNCIRAGGHVMPLGLYSADVTLPTSDLMLRGKTIHPGQMGGIHMMRDLPRFVTLIERGLLDAKSMVGGTFSLERTQEAYQNIGDRTMIATVILF